jgi:RNA 2',3'-cyclic 3'-phosphodiesterase
VRLFVAAELPEPAVTGLTAWTPRDPALRPVPAAALHLTLAFLGERSEDDAGRAAAALPALARPVGGLSAAAVRWLPPRRPRVLAVELADFGVALGALQRAVVAALVDAIGFEPEARPYLPHVTVARVRSGARAPRRALEPPALGTFGAVALTLLRSRLSPQGARYEALERTLL